LGKQFLRCSEQVVLVSSLQLFNRPHILLLGDLLVNFSLICDILFDFILFRLWEILALLNRLSLLNIHFLEHFGLVCCLLFSLLHFTSLLLLFLLLH
jgi:hypothetical protein